MVKGDPYISYRCKDSTINSSLSIFCLSGINWGLLKVFLTRAAIYPISRNIAHEQGNEIFAGDIGGDRRVKPIGGKEYPVAGRAGIVETGGVAGYQGRVV